MGMYTEILVRAELPADTDRVVLGALEAMIGREDVPTVLPDHPLFSCHRWSSLGTCTSAYHPVISSSYLTASPWGADRLALFMHASLKNYDNEIELFFDWIDPYLANDPGDFIGYSLYEEDETPTLYFKRGSAQN